MRAAPAAGVRDLAIRPALRFPPPEVARPCHQKNPITDKDYREHKHFQFLTEDTGSPHLHSQISTVTTLMRLSEDKKQYEELFDRAFAKEYQERLPLVIEI